MKKLVAIALAVASITAVAGSLNTDAAIRLGSNSVRSSSTASAPTSLWQSLGYTTNPGLPVSVLIQMRQAQGGCSSSDDPTSLAEALGFCGDMSSVPLSALIQLSRDIRSK